MRTLLVTLGLAVLACILAASASASPWPKDPRVCSQGITRQACAEATARIAARKHVGGPGGLWQGPSFRCTQVSPRTVLRWSCPFNAHTYLVTFSVAKGHWWVLVTP